MLNEVVKFNNKFRLSIIESLRTELIEDDLKRMRVKFKFMSIHVSNNI
jgi:hypothetical protein